MFASRWDEDMLPGKSLPVKMCKEKDDVRSLKDPVV
jgi:hypothetical protein